MMKTYVRYAQINSMQFECTIENREKNNHSETTIRYLHKMHSKAQLDGTKSIKFKISN